jgi:predicted phosphodiesterase
MTFAPLTDELLKETIRQWNAAGSMSMAARMAQVPRTTFQNRFHQAELKYPELIKKVDKHNGTFQPWTYTNTIIPEFEIKSVLIGGDAHIWNKEPSLMWRAFCKVAKSVKPDAIILNGDILDGAKVSRHKSLLGSRAPKISDEIDAAREWIRMLPKVQTQIWTIGNHDQRVDNYLANQAPEMEDYAGRLSDRFPDWQFGYCADINGVEVRHRFRNGIHAGWNNALHGGVTMVTSHTHQLQVTAVRNRKGSHYGIECGMLGDPSSAAFEYTEGAPSRVCPGFVLLSFDEDGHVMPPECAEMIRGRPSFRGKYVF